MLRPKLTFADLSPVKESETRQTRPTSSLTPAELPHGPIMQLGTRAKFKRALHANARYQCNARSGVEEFVRELALNSACFNGPNAPQQAHYLLALTCNFQPNTCSHSQQQPLSRAGHCATFLKHLLACETLWALL